MSKGGLFLLGVLVGVLTTKYYFKLYLLWLGYKYGNY